MLSCQMGLDPLKPNVATVQQLVKRLDEFTVRQGAAVALTPSVASPAVTPLGGDIDRVLAVDADFELAIVRDMPEELNQGCQFGPVCGPMSDAGRSPIGDVQRWVF